MTTKKFKLHDGKTGSALTVRVTPRSRRNEVVEVLHDGTVRIRLVSATTEGDANSILVTFLSEILEVPAAHIEVVAGVSGPDKLVTLLDLSADAVQQKIIKLL